MRTIVFCAGLLALTLASSAAQNPAAAPSASAGYVIGPKDVVKITIYGEPDLTGRTYVIDGDGMFSFPMIGRMQAAGLTVPQLEQALRKRLVPDFFRNPQISISVEEFLSKEIVVSGEVARPGPQPFTGDMTLLGVLARAGGALPTASGEVLIVHGRGLKAQGGSAAKPGQDDPADGAAFQFDGTRVDLNKLQAGSIRLDVEIKDGDLVIVPRAESAYVFGEVKNPGAYPVPKGSTVQQMLARAGGATPEASQGKISIDRDGTTLKKVKLTDGVRPGDTIKVPPRIF
jgi:polysaccharide export outer membrane protein